MVSGTLRKLAFFTPWSPVRVSRQRPGVCRLDFRDVLGMFASSGRCRAEPLGCGNATEAPRRLHPFSVLSLKLARFASPGWWEGLLVQPTCLPLFLSVHPWAVTPSLLPHGQPHGSPLPSAPPVPLVSSALLCISLCCQGDGAQPYIRHFPS